MKSISLIFVLTLLIFFGSSVIHIKQVSANTNSTIHVTSSTYSNGTYTINFIENGVSLIDPLDNYGFVSASCASTSCGLSGFGINAGGLTHSSLTTTAFPNNGNFSYICLYDSNSNTWCSQELPPYWWGNYSESTVQIVASPSNGSKIIGSPFNVTVNITESGSEAFNAVRANVAVSSNLSITGIHTPSSNACNLQYTQFPTTNDPSFAGAIYGSSSTGCAVYTLTLTPTATGTGAIAFTNGSIKAYSDSSEILTGVQNASFTIGNGPTPTPTPNLAFTIDTTLPTYNTTYNFTGTKLNTITHIFVNGSETSSTYPTTTTWQNIVSSLSLGDNTFTIYGTDDSNNQTTTQTVTISRHTLGDINGDDVIDLTDASLMAVDWDKTNNLTYNLSDMNGDGVVNLTDLSILAKLE